MWSTKYLNRSNIYWVFRAFYQQLILNYSRLSIGFLYSRQILTTKFFYNSVRPSISSNFYSHSPSRLESFLGLVVHRILNPKPLMSHNLYFSSIFLFSYILCFSPLNRVYIRGEHTFFLRKETKQNKNNLLKMWRDHEWSKNIFLLCYDSHTKKKNENFWEFLYSILWVFMQHYFH